MFRSETQFSRQERKDDDAVILAFATGESIKLIAGERETSCFHSEKQDTSAYPCGTSHHAVIIVYPEGS